MNGQKWQSGEGLGKIMCKRFNECWRELERQHNVQRSLSGITGVSEYSSVSWLLCGGKVREDVAKVQAEVGTRYGWTVTPANYKAIIADVEAAMPALNAAMPVEDTRKTPEEDKARQDEQKRLTAEREKTEREKEAAFLAEYGEPGAERVEIPAGHVAVTLQLCYDNSDMQSDYFDRHARLGPALLLAVVPKGPETQSAARYALSRFPEFAAYEFEWHTEKYSMGHGNYLESKAFELPAEIQGWTTAYRGGLVTHGHWEVVFRGTCTSGGFPPVKGWEAARARSTFPIASPSEKAAEAFTSGGVVVSHNEALNGVEIRFPLKPDTLTILSLKSHGFRWSVRGWCWYHRRDASSLAFAATFAGKEEAPAPAAVPDPAEEPTQFERDLQSESLLEQMAEAGM